MRCERCRESIALLDAQTSSGCGHWHTRCWNEASDKWRLYFEEMDELEGFTPRSAPPGESSPALPDELGPKPRWSEVINDMATATNNRPPRDVVEFPPNAPVTVALKYSQGRVISGQYGERVMFTLTDGRVMFLAPDRVTWHQCARVVHHHQGLHGPERYTRHLGDRASHRRAAQRDIRTRGTRRLDAETAGFGHHSRLRESAQATG
jgi:hypothetical protein